MASSGAVKFSLAALQSLLCDSPSLPASAVQPDPQIPPPPAFCSCRLFPLSTRRSKELGESQVPAASREAAEQPEHNQSIGEQVESSSLQLSRAGGGARALWGGVHVHVHMLAHRAPHEQRSRRPSLLMRCGEAAANYLSLRTNTHLTVCVCFKMRFRFEKVNIDEMPLLKRHFLHQVVFTIYFFDKLIT